MIIHLQVSSCAWSCKTTIQKTSRWGRQQLSVISFYWKVNFNSPGCWIDDLLDAFRDEMYEKVTSIMSTKWQVIWSITRSPLNHVRKSRRKRSLPQADWKIWSRIFKRGRIQVFPLWVHICYSGKLSKLAKISLKFRMASYISYLGLKETDQLIFNHYHWNKTCR